MFTQVTLFVSKLTSTKTQVPYDYYTLPFCRPHIHQESENLGEVLSGDRIENSVYKVRAETYVWGKC
jgi:transmembrane 9 superfamily protein 2/4